jgi:hypothetical protein
LIAVKVRAGKVRTGESAARDGRTTNPKRNDGLGDVCHPLNVPSAALGGRIANDRAANKGMGVIDREPSADWGLVPGYDAVSKGRWVVQTIDAPSTLARDIVNEAALRNG